MTMIKSNTQTHCIQLFSLRSSFSKETAKDVLRVSCHPNKLTYSKKIACSAGQHCIKFNIVLYSVHGKLAPRNAYDTFLLVRLLNIDYFISYHICLGTTCRLIDSNGFSTEQTGRSHRDFL